MNAQRLISLAALLLLAGAGPTWAQMFGPRSMGRPLSRRPGPGLDAQISSGSIEGGERFLRGNRRRADFVGGDSAEARRFIGLQQGNQARSVRTAVEGLTERRAMTTSLNQPRGALTAGEMLERLSLSDELVSKDMSFNPEVLSQRLSRSLSRLGNTTIGVSVAGRTATLRGAVASARNRDLAAMIVSFEPGISEVENQLVVRWSPASPTSRSPRLPPPPPPEEIP